MVSFQLPVAGCQRWAHRANFGHSSRQVTFEGREVS
jgi:hypothetical protein